MLHAVQQWAKQEPSRIALTEGDAHLTYVELWDAVQQRCEALGAYRPNALGIALNDGTDWVIAHLAALKSGIPQVPLPPFFTQQQRAHALRDAGADWLLTEAGMEQVTNSRVTLPKATALITYTSGSTGTPKGVCLSIEGMRHVAASLLTVLGKDTAQRHLSVLPLAVLLEQIGGLYATLLAGGTYIFAQVQKNPMGLAEALDAHDITSCILVPELLKLLLAQATPGMFTKLQFAAVGGARVAPGLLHQAQLLKLPVYEGYGLTESASVVAVNTPSQHRAGTVGRLLPHIRASISVEGEILLHDPAVLGYTDGTQTGNPYATGDIGRFDAEGFLRIAGRKKNLLITAFGRNVAPEWPESMLTAQPEIAQAIVYGDGQAHLSALIVPVGQPSQKALKQALARVNEQLPDYAQIEHWRRSQPFTQANGLATGNGRLRREAILQTLTKESTDGFLRPACA